ncbi:MAG: hypothetical protein V4516_05270 [Pseudomonadota bacterium]
MRAVLSTFIVCSVFDNSAVAQEVVYRNTLLEQTVESRDLLIMLDPVDEDVRFAITLGDTKTGFQRRHEFDGQGVNDPSPFQLAWMRYCDTTTILLTLEYPWRHDLPQYTRILETYAFRASDFAFIDITHGPLTDIALADDTAYETSEIDMLPPIRVHCLLGNDAKPFEFFEQETK